jgi:hypothetical protein
MSSWRLLLVAALAAVVLGPGLAGQLGGSTATRPGPTLAQRSAAFVD